MTHFTKHIHRLALISAVASVTLLAAPRDVSAQPAASAADLETARELIVKGRELRDKGDLPGALEKLRAAHALAHTPITGIELARTHVALKQPLEARDVCLGIGRMPVTREETSRSKEARDEAAKIAEDMRPKIASITVKVKAPAGRAVVVKIDDVVVPVAGLEGRKVNPGKHVVTARIDEGAEARADVDVTEGGAKEIALEPEVPKVVARRPDDTPVVPKPSEWVEEKRISPLVPIGFAVGAAGVAVGSVAGILAVSKKADLECGDNRECRNTAASDLTTARAMADVSTVAFVVGGVGVVVGVAGLLSPSTVRVRKGSLTLEPYVAGAGGGFHGTF
jgi:hypothetical protein